MAKELYASPRKDPYKIIIGANTVTKKNLLPLLKDHKKLLLISDSGVPKSIIKNITAICKLKSKVLSFTIEKGEKSKSISNFNEIINFLAEKNFDRGDAIIAVGGGVVGDISGYVASSYMRGIQYIQIPTTLLAQVDSSVGGKTAINISAGKNLVGAFYNPKGVIIDITSLKTLTKRELMAGLAEVIKYGLIKNKVLFDLLQQNTQKIMNLNNGVIEKMIYESISTKASIVTKDEKEKGIRAILNFGHTVGHAIEAQSKYRKILHGEAVAKGMLVASKISLSENMITDTEFNKIRDLLRSYKFDLSLEHYKYSDLKPFIFRDKKIQKGKLNLILLTGISHAVISNKFDPNNLKKSIG